MDTKRLQEARLKANLTQEELADAVGCKQVFVSYIERGLKKPSIDLLVRIADKLDCTTDYLLGK